MAVVQTTYGRVQGLERGGHEAYFGIPYAASIAGARRFRAPEPPEPWSGVREATEPGDAAPQGQHPVQGFAASGPRGEDCLNLNVFTPASDGRRRPVMLWIHGGGYTHGAGYEPLYNGGPLAERGDVVVVTINYRLGAIGYAHLGDGTDDNRGARDQVAALEWVRDNIEAFGGDPGDVTVFGESAGAGGVAVLLAMPSARGLFQRAIMQSGGARALRAEAATKAADSLLAELGVDRRDLGALEALPHERIVEAQERALAVLRPQGIGFSPMVDPATLPQSPRDAFRDGFSADIPLLIGTNRDEVKLFLPPRRDPIADEDLPAAVRPSLDGASEDDARAVVDAYRAARAASGLSTDNLDLLDAVNTDARFRVPTQRVAGLHRAHQPNTYNYLFTWESPARRGAFGSCHALEMPFVFGTLDAPTQDKFAGTGPEAERLSANMMDAWLAFVRSGNPSHEGIGEWPAWDAERRPVMVFARESGTQHDPLGAERAAIEPFVP